MTAFANRSPLHAFFVWLVKTSLILAVSVIAYLLVTNVVVPGYIDQMVQQIAD